MAGKERGWQYIKWFSSSSKQDVVEIGIKASTLVHIKSLGLPVKDGFVITGSAYNRFLSYNHLVGAISQLLELADFDDVESFTRVAEKIRAVIENSEFPDDLKEEIHTAYGRLEGGEEAMKEARGGALEILRRAHHFPFVAVRSSVSPAMHESLSYAGIYDSFFNVHGIVALEQAIKRCISSAYSARSLFYMRQNDFSHEMLSLPIIIQKMAYSDISGAAFSRNPIDGSDEIIVESVWGLGEGLHSGMMVPDSYHLKPQSGQFILSSSIIADKKIAVTRDSSGKNALVHLHENRSSASTLDEREIRKIATLVRKCEDYVGGPCLVSFSISDGEFDVHGLKKITLKNDDHLELPSKHGKAFFTGRGMSAAMGAGAIRFIKSSSDVGLISPGDIFVCETAGTDLLVLFDKIGGLISQTGGLSSTVAQLAREFHLAYICTTTLSLEDVPLNQRVLIDSTLGGVYELTDEEPLENRQNESVTDEMAKEDPSPSLEIFDQHVSESVPSNEEYQPTIQEQEKKDIPPLNDAIPITSESLDNEPKKEKTLDIF